MPRLALGMSLALLLALSAVPPASADPVSPQQRQVDAVLAAHPGGTQTGPGTISWDDGATVLTLVDPDDPDDPATRSVGSCATGAYCAYNAVSLTGSRLSFTTCDTTVSLAALPGDVRSLANARSTGYVQGRTASGTTLTTVSAGGRVNSAPAGVEQLRCVG